MHSFHWIGLAVLLLLSGVAVAQDAGAEGVNVRQHEELGTYLTDAEGMSLYIYEEDQEGESACYDECASTWPPFVADGEVGAGSGVAASLLGETERSDGEAQVMYNGWPLYTYAEDAEPGDVAGHGVGGAWFLVSPYGSPLDVPDEASDAESEGGAEPSTEVADIGGSTYSQHCAVCHGDSGRGAVGPAFVDNDSLESEGYVVRQILFGNQYMPPFMDQLSDTEVANVATFIRESWGNEFGPVSEEEVVEQKER